MTMGDLAYTLTPYVEGLNMRVWGSKNAEFSLSSRRGPPEEELEAYLEAIRRLPTSPPLEVPGLVSRIKSMRHRLTALEDKEVLGRAGLRPGEVDDLVEQYRGRPGHLEVLGLLDTDQDGLIGYDEFLLVVTLLSIPLRLAETGFTVIDESEDGMVDREELAQLLSLVGPAPVASSSKVRAPRPLPARPPPLPRTHAREGHMAAPLWGGRHAPRELLPVQGLRAFPPARRAVSGVRPVRRGVQGHALSQAVRAVRHLALPGVHSE